MAADTLNLYENFADLLGNGDMDLGADTIEIALSNTAPVATHTTRSQIVEIATGGGYTQGAHPLDNVTYVEASGTGTLGADDEVITASGSIAQFRYVVFYNSNTADVVDGLIGWVDHGSALDMTTGQTLTVGLTSNILTIA